ncbi:hypothetical protein ABL78_7714 [Leptomonas seymouri]|uniref:Swiss Army Knife RNA repair protein HAD domain-containing protein n=1 Tax=Leptomonas seymouri TaxID=5684 RepID=A0A0N0P2R2_LEPSE|nr:hypothetical protein ABL78_7714 [Leptomonas seymouri]|eukprot:KPI83256.1 hypothetical protein ABL78_7714 [Leptomonas seymouri]
MPSVATEVHIFDFDGTLFYSPAPTLAAAASLIPPTASGGAAASTFNDSAAVEYTTEADEKRRVKEANELYGKLLNPIESGGYGWFQSIHTMVPPSVPEKPDPNIWFVQPILNHMRALVQRRNELRRHPLSKAKDRPVLYVLTGRDVKYRDRIRTLLQQVGLYKEVERVILKPKETAGTVKYKLNNFFNIIQRHRPSRVFYYEDRVEQGGRLLEGIQVLEEVLYYRPGGSGSGDAAVNRVGVVTFDVTTADGTHFDPLAHGGASYSPQPKVVLHFGAHARGNLPQSPAEADPRHRLMISTLRSSPYTLLREACYPLDRATAFCQRDADTVGRNAKHPEKQAQKWVEGTISFWNSREASRRGDGDAASRGRGPEAPIEKPTFTMFDAHALHNSIQFGIAPPFTFIMVLVPAAIRDRSNCMLDAGQFAALVERLKAERGPPKRPAAAE